MRGNCEYRRSHARAAKPALKPTVTDAPATSTAAAAPAARDAQLAGSQPIVHSNSFDSRFGAMK
ncbi:hypothetical protein [Bradyrhizobium sp. USDA 10063]